ncbi:MAG: glycosyltransferase [Candidatus Lokiarchaeota archaeon]|nr:glycosyltransferase [Candidatus Lokiarchaeota archaeon]
MVKHQLDIGFFSCMYSQVNGTAHAVSFLSEAIAKLGHNVHVFAPKIQNGHDIPKTLHYHSLGGAVVDSKTGFVLSVPINKYFNCEHDYLDVLHTHTHETVGSMGALWSKQLGIPVIGTHNGPMAFYSAQYLPVIGKALVKTDLIWRYERHILDLYDFVHVPTKSKKDLLRDYRFREPIICLSNGIPDLFYSEVKENGIREKYGLEGKKVLLYASRLSPEKHNIKIIKVFKKIHDQVPDSHLLLVGSEGPSTENVKSIIKNPKYSEFVSYAGRVPFLDLLRLYNTADVTCLWSWVEAEGLVLIEAMAQGTPSVGANAYGIKDVIRHGETGYLANNIEEFQNYVIKLFKDDALRAQFGIRAKEISQDYKISEIAKTWVNLYKFAINEVHPLKYRREKRAPRVNLVKNYVKQLSNVSF